MDVLIIPIVVLFGSILTFFSGFGLGTLLLPAFSLFFPVEVAIFSTAIVHFFNSMFKVILIYKKINYILFFQFALTAVPFAILGAWLLSNINEHNISIQLNFGIYKNRVSSINLLIGTIMILFAIVELVFKETKIMVSKKSLLLGGAISGLFGGISGHQGAFRSMFLSKAAITKEEFVATSSSIGFVIDLTRIVMYLSSISLFVHFEATLKWILLLSIFVAFCGSYLGAKFLTKTTFRFLQILVAVSLMIMGILLSIGIL
jgi:uncharacterized membrane protein YfcA